MLGLPPAEVRRHLAAAKVAVVGLGGLGAHAATALAACGVGALVLVDPDPCRPGDLALLPPLGPGALGRPREQALQAAIGASSGGTVAAVGGAQALTAEGLAALARDCQLLVGSPADGSAAADSRVNRAGIATGVPALFGRLEGHVAMLGPLVVPGRTACHACWLARRAAGDADPSPEAAAPPGRAVPPPLAAAAGATLALEALKHLLGAGLPTLAGRVQRLDALGAGGELHAVLRVPDCPACSTPWPAGPPPPLERLAAAAGPAGDLLAAAPFLLSPVCGVVTALGPLPRHPDEPAVPHVVGARLAAHPRFDDPDRRLCSGKGTTAAEARAGALGEALERYASVSWPATAVSHARRDELRGGSLDPRELVLYLPEQYPGLPYAPYGEATRLGWVPARSLASGAPVHVPAVAVLMGYRPASPAEDICPPTSTGIASGETLAAAVLTALCEVLERDAFMVTWMNRLPARRVDPSSHPDPEVADLCGAYARRGVRVELYLLAADHSCRVFLALGVQELGDGPAVVAGLGADLDPARAARKALLEVGQVRPALRIDLRSPRTRSRVEALVADPSLATGPDDHALLYADRRSAGAFDFLRRGPVAGCDWAAPGPAAPADRLGSLVAELRSLGGDVLYHDLTPPELARLGLWTARVVVPGFQPVHFGAGRARLGGGRLYELPHRLGITPAPTTPAALNRDPHPLA
ncbi:MAG TPA: TOMM precursor leader peptide-binding protein [Actinomycetota bacterium]